MSLGSGRSHLELSARPGHHRRNPRFFCRVTSVPVGQLPLKSSFLIEKLPSIWRELPHRPGMALGRCLSSRMWTETTRPSTQLFPAGLGALGVGDVGLGLRLPPRGRSRKRSGRTTHAQPRRLIPRRSLAASSLHDSSQRVSLPVLRTDVTRDRPGTPDLSDCPQGNPLAHDSEHHFPK